MQLLKKNPIIWLLSSLILYTTVSYGMESQEHQSLSQFPEYFLRMPNPGLVQDYEAIKAYTAAIAYAQKHLLSRPIAALDSATFLHEIRELHKRICPMPKDSPGYIRTKEALIVFDLGIGHDPNKSFDYLLTLPDGQQKCRDLRSAFQKQGVYGSIEAAWPHLSQKERSVFDEVGYVTPMPEEVNGLLEAMVKKLNKDGAANVDPIILAAYVHKEITRIHPFANGNGRVARLLMNLILIQNNQIPVVFFDDNEYTQKVKEGDKDLDKFVEYLRVRIDELHDKKPIFGSQPSQAEIDAYEAGQRAIAAKICTCGKAGSQICGRCMQQHYCSRECQKKDWPAHKQQCKK